MATVEANGIRLYYEEAGSGTPILFIHGMCGHANVWDDQVRRLSGEFRCVTYDRRGHTRSAPVGDVVRTVGLHADDAAALIEALGLAPCLLVGSSGGARIGVDLVRRYPNLLLGAVLSEPPLASLDAEAGRSFIAGVQPRLEAALASGRPEAAVDAFFDYVCPGLWNAIDETRRQTYRANQVELLGDLRMPPYQVAAADLGQVRVPCRVVVGERTLPFLQRVTTLLAEAIPGAELIEIPASGHVTYAENTEAFATGVRDFAARLKRVPSTR